MSTRRQRERRYAYIEEVEKERQAAAKKNVKPETKKAATKKKTAAKKTAKK